jgi:hypothetical protein
MKTFTIESFKIMVESFEWHHTSSYEHLESHILENSRGDDIKINCGGGRVESILGEMKVTYEEGYQYNEGDKNSFIATSHGLDSPYTLDGFIVVDEDGDELSQGEIDDLLDSSFKSVDYDDLMMSI